MLSQLRRPNLVPLIGFCNEEDKLVLDYEYMTACSLHDYIYHKGTNKVDSLLCKRRLQIYSCIELHTRVKYVHDIKTQDILLLVNFLSSGGYISSLGKKKLPSEELYEMKCVIHSENTYKIVVTLYKFVIIQQSSLFTNRSYKFGIIFGKSILPTISQI